MPVEVIEITLREAVEMLERKIRSQSFRKAVGGKKMLTAIIALIEYVKTLPESELDRKVSVRLE